MFQVIKKLLRKKKKVCLVGCAVQYFEKVAFEAKLSDQETQERTTFKNHPDVHFLSRGQLANFSPEMLDKSKELPVTENFEWPENTRAYTNIDLGFEYLKIAE